MWICTNYGFFSAVLIDETRQGKHDENVYEDYAIRARTKAHLEQAFPSKQIFNYKFSDYDYRVYCTKEELLGFVFTEVNRITYTNFKNSVKNLKLKAFFGDIWWLGVNQLNDNM
jgi:hypothetical protein